MRRLSLRAVVAFTAPAFLAAPAAFAQYDTRGDDMPAAIALFSDENFYGDVRDVYDPFSTLSDLSFNDKPRSVAVFAGQWELCEHKNFTGRCVFVKEDVSDLGWFGLNGRITSVRPVYEYTEASHGLMFSRDKQGYIRYADNEIYGYDTWDRGYASSWGLSVSHFGYSSDYYRYGYYSPAWGYDPYGFAWGPRGTIRYTSSYRRHPRPSVINSYWSGWDWHPSDWRHGHWSWRGNDGHDWRDNRDWRRGDRDHRDGDGHGGRDWRPGDRDDRPARDVPGDGWGPGSRGTGVVTPPIPSDPRPGRGTGWRPDDRRSGTDGPRGGRGVDAVVDPAPIDPGLGRTGRGGRGAVTDPGISVMTPPEDPPRIGRGGRSRDTAVDTGGLLGGPDTDGRSGGDDWRRRGGDDDTPRPGRFGEGMSGGGIFGVAPERQSVPAAAPPPPPPPPPPREERRERPAETDDGGGEPDGPRRGPRRRDGDE